MTHTMFSKIRIGLLGLSLAAGLTAFNPVSYAATLTLEASAKAQVNNDEMVVMMAFERDGNDLASINQTVLQALNSGLEEAKKVAQVKARLGNVSTNPNWNAQGRPNGWRVRGEIILTSGNLAGLGKLAGDLSQRLQLGSIQFRLSEETRNQAEKKLIVEAANAFRIRAKEAATALGFNGYAIKDLNLNNGYNVTVRPMAMARGKMDTMSSAPVPTDSGDSEVQVTFNGSIDLK
jgi:predicted secreted protein